MMQHYTPGGVKTLKGVPRLRVVVGKVRGLKHEGEHQVTVSLIGQKSKSTPWIDGGHSKSFNRECTFDLRDFSKNKEFWESAYLQIAVINKRTIFADKQVGQTFVSLMKLYVGGPMQGWILLEHKSKRGGDILLKAEVIDIEPVLGLSTECPSVCGKKEESFAEEVKRREVEKRRAALEEASRAGPDTKHSFSALPLSEEADGDKDGDKDQLLSSEAKLSKVASKVVEGEEKERWLSADYLAKQGSPDDVDVQTQLALLRDIEARREDFTSSSSSGSEPEEDKADEVKFGFFEEAEDDFFGSSDFPIADFPDDAEPDPFFSTPFPADNAGKTEKVEKKATNDEFLGSFWASEPQFEEMNDADFGNHLEEEGGSRKGGLAPEVNLIDFEFEPAKPSPSTLPNSFPHRGMSQDSDVTLPRGESFAVPSEDQGKQGLDLLGDLWGQEREEDKGTPQLNMEAEQRQAAAPPSPLPVRWNRALRDWNPLQLTL